MNYRYQKPLECIVIDDDVDFLVHIERVLKVLGINVVTTENKDDFYNRLVQVQPEFCVVDLDLNGTLDGFTVIREMRTRYRYQKPIFVLSAATDLADVEKALDLGATDYCTKPLNRNLLSKKLSYYFEESLLFPRARTFKSINEGPIQIDVDMPLQIDGVDELGVRFSSMHLIPKGTIVHFSGDFISEVSGEEKLMGFIVSISLNSISKTYSYYAEFENLSPQGLNRIRSWIRCKLTGAA